MMMGRWFGGYGYGGLFDGWAMGLGMLVNLIFWGAIIYLVIRLIRHHQLSGRCCSGSDIVRERYARGEITKEQYQDMLSTLKSEETRL